MAQRPFNPPLPGSAPRGARSLRLFFALWPSAAMQSALVKVAAPLVDAAGSRPVLRENLHVTLAFLGSVPEKRFADLAPAAEAVAAKWRARSSRAIELSLDRIEHWRKPEILCASVTTTPQSASDLATDLKDALVVAGFAPDLKPFRVHVTLARKVARARDASLTPVTWRFDSFVLVASQTGPNGSSYSVVGRWVLD